MSSISIDKIPDYGAKGPQVEDREIYLDKDDFDTESLTLTTDGDDVFPGVPRRRVRRWIVCTRMCGFTLL